MPETVILGPPPLLARCAPPDAPGLGTVAVEGPGSAGAIAGADVAVAFDPSSEQLAALRDAGLPALLWWSDAPPPDARGTAGAGWRTICGAPLAPRGAWRSLPLPVADVLYRDGGPPDEATAINFGEDDRAAAEHRARIALAEARLLISEPFSPPRGLEPGIDYLEARAPEDAEMLAANAARSPSAFERIRVRGRRKAELFRASAMVERLVGDLLLELGLASGAGGRAGRSR